MLEKLSMRKSWRVVKWRHACRRAVYSRRDISAAASLDARASTRQKPEIFDDIQRSISQTTLAY